MEHGFGTPEDPHGALTWYRLAGAQGHVLSQLKVGKCYETGIGCRPDPVQAALWLRRAASQGYAPAQLELGLFYANEKESRGENREKEAVRWITAAASDGLPDAQYRLALLYAIGRGVAANPAKAISWAKASASQGNPNALLFLASALQRGDGVEQNIASALALTLRAQEQTDGELDMIGALEAVASPSERSEAQKLSARYPEDSALVAALF